MQVPENPREIAVSRYDPDFLYRLPGREWQLLLGPQTGESQRMTMSIATFPAGSAPPLHVHPDEEEMVYVLAGTGRLVNEGEDVRLEPGVAFRVPVGARHGAVNDGDAPLRLLCVFDPPVMPGSYEAGR
jgi:quercetin dioxygenase-like cupin family protein